MDNIFGLRTEKIYTILELNTAVRSLIRMEFPNYIWVCGEIQDLRDRGAINLNLVQKHPEFDELVAQVKAVIFENVKPQIVKRIKEADSAFELKKDIEVKLLCKVDLYAKTGSFSLTVVDIDPIYTLGKMAQSRQRIIEELRVKGYLERNKSIAMPQLPLRIDLITAVDSAAYHDFVDELKKSSYGFSLSVHDCYMQGKLVETSILAALEQCNQRLKEELDAIVISRGGGSTADLSCFDNKRIAEAIATSKFPIICALGHQINTTIADLVAHTSVKTPTKGAQFLVERVGAFVQELNNLEEEILEKAQDYLSDATKNLSAITVKIDALLPRYFKVHTNDLVTRESDMQNIVKSFLAAKRRGLVTDAELLGLHINKIFKDCRHAVHTLEEKVRILNPKNVLKRGYSVTLKEGKALKSIDNIKEGDIIKTLLYEGNVDSRVMGKTSEASCVRQEEHFRKE
ncbi:MAG: exodeoxyribonuclease VII large subunit [Candidatus Omnitrophica bacterium]|nr:exodeoxyribonuclease VII large subunit [Candidatus Omnitrophota bacterium]